MRALFLNLAIHVAMRALAILAACVALVSACSSNPKTTAGPVAADGPPIGRAGPENLHSDVGGSSVL